MRIDTQHPHYAALCDLATGMQYSLEDVTGEKWFVTVCYLAGFDMAFRFCCGLHKYQSRCLDSDKPIDRPDVLKHTLIAYFRDRIDPELRAVLQDIRARQEAQ
jgi:hypothetical protein